MRPGMLHAAPCDVAYKSDAKEQQNIDRRKARIEEIAHGRQIDVPPAGGHQIAQHRRSREKYQE